MCNSSAASAISSCEYIASTKRSRIPLQISRHGILAARAATSCLDRNSTFISLTIGVTENASYFRFLSARAYRIPTNIVASADSIATALGSGIMIVALAISCGADIPAFTQASNMSSSSLAS
jgi:hypothetical protein